MYISQDYDLDYSVTGQQEFFSTIIILQGH